MQLPQLRAEGFDPQTVTASILEPAGSILVAPEGLLSINVSGSTLPEVMMGLGIRSLA